MYREIKFRAMPLEKEYNFFVYGSLISQGGTFEITEADRQEDDFEYPTWEVKENTIGQFTGLKDKNGKEIYEGDILTYLGAIGQVYYCDDNAMFMCNFKLHRSSYSFDSMDEPFEIIGNIYEHPNYLNLIKHKQIPQEMMEEYKKLDIPFDNFNDFFDKYANGKRQGDGIDSRYLGYANDVTIFWFTDEEYPFAYVYPKSFDAEFRNGYFFYVRNANGA